MAVATIKAAAAALRRRFVGTFGGDEQVLREVPRGRAVGVGARGQGQAPGRGAGAWKRRRPRMLAAARVCARRSRGMGGGLEPQMRWAVRRRVGTQLASRISASGVVGLLHVDVYGAARLSWCQWCARCAWHGPHAMRGGWQVQRASDALLARSLRSHLWLPLPVAYTVCGDQSCVGGRGPSTPRTSNDFSMDTWRRGLWAPTGKQGSTRAPMERRPCPRRASAHGRRMHRHMRSLRDSRERSFSMAPGAVRFLGSGFRRPHRLSCGKRSTRSGRRRRRQSSRW